MAKQSYGEVCPKGTVPIRRLTMDTMRNFKTLEDFRKNISSAIEPPRLGSTLLRQYAQASEFGNYHGAEAVFNVWSPYTERPDEFSLSQMWVSRGFSFTLETIEAGWQTYVNLYGDSRSRLFIYFTPDNYGSGGCYNLTCSGFVQTDNSVYIGGDFTNYSSIGGSQYVFALRWQKGGSNNAWWLRYGNTWVGYYPESLFRSNGFGDRATAITFGGEILNRQTDGHHTHTDMGSGRWPNEGYSYAAYQLSIQSISTTNTWGTPTLTSTATDTYCYKISLNSNSGWGQHFYFGGPGYNPLCK